MRTGSPVEHVGDPSADRLSDEVAGDSSRSDKTGQVRAPRPNVAAVAVPHAAAPSAAPPASPAMLPPVLAAALPALSPSAIEPVKVAAGPIQPGMSFSTAWTNG